MSVGPITIFDKSALELLSVDEACLFGHFYRINLTPIFYVETLADLEKQVADGRTPEHVVGSIAYRTAGMTADANVHHLRICLTELLGEKIPIDRGFPAIDGGRPVRVKEKKGLVHKQGPELDALTRWQNGEFEEVERRHAKAWREALAALDLEVTYRTFRPFVERVGKPKSLAEAKSIADTILNDAARAEAILGYTFGTLDIPTEFWGPIFGRWQGADKPTLPRFAPYVAHVLGIDLFFSIAIGADLISKDRPSNKADLAYLYYLPFCMVFTSNDKLHAKMARLFLRPDQEFVWGGDLKEEMRRLDAHYSALPREILEQGLMRFASEPPDDTSFLTTRLVDKFMPGWRLRDKTRTPADAADRLIKEVKEYAQAPSGEEVGIDDADFVVFERRVPIRMGKWRILPPGAEKNEFPPFR
jgi:hypothetical protein